MMKKYMVLYKTRDIGPFDKPLGFACSADDYDHANEQCEDANKPCTVIHISEKETLDAAYEEYLWQDDEELA